MTGAIESPAYENEGFTIAVWVPSYFDLEKWARRGINVAWFQPASTRAEVDSGIQRRLRALDMKMWRYPAQYMEPPVDSSFDATDAALAAYSLLDEPMVHKKTPEDMKEQAGVSGSQSQVQTGAEPRGRPVCAGYPAAKGD